ncbi:hypothetical protein [Synoicihabitans lomoniglobus]|uniref:Uncharacterized protein n=1 Tax=Synoicihabitans lomoniglobus TaxID=2909285 RepID=A0AAF0CSU5_9BACT|nr:hypothetical protein [Opitutaceae bacterium LMO-M01]WED67415.1 hypothetical protein PXH66_11200 [Opitutaceae bacterium LMO-M01]
MFQRFLSRLRSSRGPRTTRWTWVAVYVAVVAWMLFKLAGYYSPETGMTYFLGVGEDALAKRDWTKDLGFKVFVHDRSFGYDGQFYAQLALDPGMENEGLAKSVDNLPYRARRILLPVVAYVLGAGRPEWIITAYVMINVVCWLALGGVLLRWFPPKNFDRAIRWLGVMLSVGACFSVYSSLVDGPSLLLFAVALKWWEQGRPWRATALLAVAGLAKETNILGSGLFAPDQWRSWKDWPLAIARVVLVAAPLGLWILLLRWRFADMAQYGGGTDNFDLPLRAMVTRVGELLDVASSTDLPWYLLGVGFASIISLVVQAGFLLLRWKWSQPAWRLTVPIAALTLVMGAANWAGYPGGVTRSLLPMLLGFNLLVPQGKRWLPVLILGNLTMFFSPGVFKPLPDSLYSVRISNEAQAMIEGETPELRLDFPPPWHAAERSDTHQWRWTGGRANIVIHNPYDQPVEVTLAGEWAAFTDRQARLRQSDRILWQEQLGITPRRWRIGNVRLPPGESHLTVESDAPAQPASLYDERSLDIRFFSLSIQGRTVGEHQPVQPPNG